MMRPRRFVQGRVAFLLISLSALLVLFSLPLRGEKGVRKKTASSLQIAAHHAAAVEKGLRFLAMNQNFSGSFGPEKARIAISALSCLSFMANGSTPNRGRYGVVVWKGIKYLMSKVQAKPKGYIFTPEDGLSRMHGHGYATLALAQVYGMFGLDEKALEEYSLEDLRERLEEAVKCIEKAQSPDGGWYYEPDHAGYHEGSVTVCQVQALRAAKNVGIKVDLQAIDKAIEYLRRSQNEDGSFCYSLLEKNRRGTFALCAAALSTLNALGKYDTTDVKKGLGYLERTFDLGISGRVMGSDL